MDESAGVYSPFSVTYRQVEHGAEGLISYAVHPGAILTNMSKGLPSEIKRDLLTDTPELAGDTIAFLTRERREWLAGRYISCESCCEFGAWMSTS